MVHHGKKASNPTTASNEGDWLDRAVWMILVKFPLRLILFYILCYGSFLLCFRLSAISDHGSRLGEFVENVSGLSYEVQAEFGLGGIKFCETTQENAHRVNFNDTYSTIVGLLNFQQFTLVHNHPIDVPFSTIDLVTTATIKPKYSIVVSQDTVYTLAAPQGWPSPESVNSYCNSFLYNGEDSVEKGFLSAKEFPDLGVTSHVTTNLFLEDFADTFELSYEATPLEEWLAVHSQDSLFS